jgi:hypothetical protein
MKFSYWKRRGKLFMDRKYRKFEVMDMCKTCGCTPCKCGEKIVNGVCEGCGKPYDECTC